MVNTIVNANCFGIQVFTAGHASRRCGCVHSVVIQVFAVVLAGTSEQGTLLQDSSCGLLHGLCRKGGYCYAQEEQADKNERLQVLEEKLHDIDEGELVDVSVRCVTLCKHVLHAWAAAQILYGPDCCLQLPEEHTDLLCCDAPLF